MSVSIKIMVKYLLVPGVIMSFITSFCYAETISSRRLVEVVDFSSPVVSRNGANVAFRIEQASIERNTYDTTWFVQDMNGTSPPRRVADGGVPLRNSAGLSLPAPVTWSLDGRWIYYRALIDGKIDVWRAATDGSGAQPIARDPADVRGFSLSADGQVLTYSVGATREEVISAEQAEYDNGIRIDETVPIGQNLFRSGYIEGRLATQRLGPWFSRVSLLADIPDRWMAVDLGNLTRRSVAPSGVPPKPLTSSDFADGLAEPWKFAKDPGSDRIALLTRVGERGGLRDRPDVELAVLPGIKTRQVIKCLAELCTKKPITDIQWRPNSDEVVFTVTDPDKGLAQSIFRWNVETGAVHAVANSLGQIGGGGRWVPDMCGLSSSALACVAAEANRPPRLERIDLDSGDHRILFDPNAALASDVAATAKVRLLRWKDAQGRTFTGQFFPAQNTGENPPPLFVTYYRCLGFLRGGVGDEWPLSELAGHGISSLCINDAPYRLDAIERYELGRSAVESAVELLASAGEIDRTKVGMGGLSFGTEVTLWTAMHSDFLAAASISSPPASPTYYLMGGLKGDAFYSGLRELWQLGSLDETAERWKTLSPTYNIKRFRSPILMQLPEQEYIYTLDYAIPLLREHLADLYVFPNEPHQKFQPRHKLAVYQRNLDWFRFWLLGVEDSDSAKSPQYSHWRMIETSLLSSSLNDDVPSGN